MLEEAVRQCASWDKEGLSVDVSATLSLRGLREAGLPEHIAALFAQYGLAPARLTLALTESALAAQPERCRALLALLAEVGVRLAIDDVGGGYSILGLLQGLPVHELKMDRTFLRHARQAGAGDGRPLGSLVLALGQALGVEVVAEGVATAALQDELPSAARTDDAASDGDVVQPLLPDDLARWMRATRETGVAEASGARAS